MTSAQFHAEAMASAVARGGALAEAWLEAHAAKADTEPIDVALADAVRDYRRAEKKHRRALKREASTNPQGGLKHGRRQRRRHHRPA